MRNYNEANNNLKALWHETTGDVEFPQQNLNAPIMGIDNQNFRPKTLDLFSPPSAVEWHSEQISPLHFSSIPFIQDGNMTEIQQQNRRQRKILPVPLTTQKQHFLDFNDEIDCNNELDAQQLLGNLCCVSDDEYSRSSIISSNIDSGNESPPAASEDSTKVIFTPCVLNIQQSNKIIRTSQHTSALTSLEETQQRRSSESDKTTIVPINSASQPGPVVVEGINSTQARSCNKSTASSSLASILSSSSSNSATMALYPQSNVQKSAFLTNSNNKNTSPFNSQTTGTVTSMKEDTIIENKESTQPSVRLPVFERLFLNQ
ncbi:hypothetical protein Mgra_00008618 [Meloidogyne graminicola]|uniref:Uncharacterized protein n=1 Tax=Meloidogyne graminicola TaxID=189291 RepID=A0A8S9ZFA7_9BILA|nr:hypothetical protein Mgra_00008618 [Meloidogyne graminicola]